MIKMASQSPRLAYRSSPRNHTSPVIDDSMTTNNNHIVKLSPKKQAHMFAQWYKSLMDGDRNSLGLYIADGAVLKWFGRTMKSKKDIIGFLRYDMNCNNHKMLSIKVSDPIPSNTDTNIKHEESSYADDMKTLACPLSDTPSDIIRTLNRVTINSSSCKRTRDTPSSPESSPTSIMQRKKKLRSKYDRSINLPNSPSKYNLRVKNVDNCMDSPSTSTGNSPVKNRLPVNFDVTKLDRNYMEASCILEFVKTRNKRSADMCQWERQCKLQVAYSEDPIHPGEYIVWTIIYSGSNSCRRNLLAAFNAA